MIFVAMEIMSAYQTRLFTFSAVVSAAFCAFSASSPATEITLQHVPLLTVEQTPAYPENVARFHSGAAVEAAPRSNPVSRLELSSKANDANTAEAALLCDDPTVSYALSQGQSSLIISLSKIENVDSLSFLNRGAKGKLTVSISDTKLPADSAQWRSVSNSDLTGEAMKLKVGPSEAKFVKLGFDVSEPGRIAALGIYSAPSVAAFTMSRAHKLSSQDYSENVALISYNVTDVHAKARALFVSSGDQVRQANNMIDDQPATTYSFAPNDATPTAIIDLGKVTKLRRISTVYSARQGNIDFFVAASLPVQAKGKTLRLDDTAFADMQMVGSVADSSGRASVDFPETTGRYIVVRWTPISQPGATFSVAEVAAFGNGNQGGLFAANTSYGAIDGLESDGKSVRMEKTPRTSATAKTFRLKRRQKARLPRCLNLLRLSSFPRLFPSVRKLDLHKTRPPSSRLQDGFLFVGKPHRLTQN